MTLAHTPVSGCIVQQLGFLTLARYTDVMHVPMTDAAWVHIKNIDATAVRRQLAVLWPHTLFFSRSHTRRHPHTVRHVTNTPLLHGCVGQASVEYLACRRLPSGLDRLFVSRRTLR